MVRAPRTNNYHVELTSDESTLVSQEAAGMKAVVIPRHNGLARKLASKHDAPVLAVGGHTEEVFCNPWMVAFCADAIAPQALGGRRRQRSAGCARVGAGHPDAMRDRERLEPRGRREPGTVGRPGAHAARSETSSCKPAYIVHNPLGPTRAIGKAQVTWKQAPSIVFRGG